MRPIMRTCVILCAFAISLTVRGLFPWSRGELHPSRGWPSWCVDSGYTHQLAIHKDGTYAQTVPVISPSPRATVRENDGTTLTCRYSPSGGCPSSLLFEWWRNGAKVLLLAWNIPSCILGEGDDSRLQFSCSVDQASVCVFTLTLDQVQNSQHGDEWQCLILEKFSSNTNIYVQVPITSVQLTLPTDNQVSVVENEPYSFACETSPGRPVATIQWFKQLSSDTTEVTSWVTSGSRSNGTLTIGTSTLDYRASQSDQGHEIYCQAIHVASPAFTSSRKPVLTILYAPSVAALQNQRVIVSRPFTRACIVTEGRPSGATVGWTRSGDSWSQSGTTLNLDPVVRADDTDYTCTASNTMVPTGGTGIMGSDDKTFTLTVLYAPTINAIPDRSVVAESQLSVTCTTTPGIPAQTSYRWTRSTGGGWSQDGQTLSISNIQKSDAADYTCTAWNMMDPTDGVQVRGEDTETFTVDVLYPPTINAIPDRSVISKSDMTVTCASTPGNPPATTYRWTRSTDPSWSHNGATLTIGNVQTADAGDYTCTAWNEMAPTVGAPRNGEDTEPFTLDVLYPPTINAIPDRSVVAESALTVACTITPGNPPATTYRWTRSTNPSWSRNGATLNIASVQKTDAADYMCTAWNVMTPTVGAPQNGEDEETFTLDVLYAPAIDPLQDMELVLESTLTVTCTTSPGNPPATTYRWTRSTGSAWSRTGATLTIPSVQKTDAADYTCTATNVMRPSTGGQISGSDTETFNLNVLYKTSITRFSIIEKAGASPNTVDENSTVTFQCSVESNPGSDLTISGPRGVVLVRQGDTRDVTYAASMGCLDAGLYECRGYNYLNGADRPTQNLELRVRCHPRPPGSVEPIIKVYKALHDQVTLNVSFIAYPSPTFRWFKQRSSNSDAYDQIPSETQITFTIDDLKQADFIQYKAVVANGITPNYEQVYIIEAQGEPETPNNITVDETHNSAVVQWLHGFNGGLTQTFFIEYRKAADPGWSLLDAGVETTDPFNKTVDELVPGTDYVIRMYARNSYGKSDVSEEIQFTTLAAPESTTPLPIGAIAGGAAGAVAAIVVVVVVVIVLVRRRRAKPKDKSVNIGDDDDDEPNITENVHYDSSDAILRTNEADPSNVYSTVNKAEAVPLEAVYSMPDKKKGKKDAKKDDKDLGDLYATPIKKKDKKSAPNDSTNNADLYATPIKKKDKKSEAKDAGGKKNKGGGKKKDKKGKDAKAPPPGDLYENAATLPVGQAIYANSKDNLVYEDVGPGAPPQKPPKPSRTENKDGLIYLELDFKNDPNKASQNKVIGIDDMTEYGEIDFNKKADPLPDSDQEDK